MAISIDWATQVITVPKADTSLVDIGPPEIRSLDVNQFRKDLNALQAGEEGMPEPTTHVHVAPLTVGGVTLARSVEIINGYTVTFEDGSYAVNLIGANNNIGDVANLNTVSIRSANTAGLVDIVQILELWKFFGLDIANPMTVTRQNRVAGDVSVSYTGDHETTTTVTRDP